MLNSQTQAIFFDPPVIDECSGFCLEKKILPITNDDITVAEHNVPRMTRPPQDGLLHLINKTIDYTLTDSDFLIMRTINERYIQTKIVMIQHFSLTTDDFELPIVIFYFLPKAKEVN